MSLETPNPLLSTLGALLQGGLNRLIALDPEAGARLAPLEGRSLEFGWAPAGIAMRVRVSEARLAIGPAGGDAADLAMHGNLAGFLRLALPGASAGLPPGKVSVSGDAELARELERLLKDFRPDLGAGLDARMGPAAGALAGRVIGGLVDGLRAALRTVPEDVATYLREERRDTIAKEELEDFAGDVDRLRDDLERLAARVARLASGGGSRA